MNDLKWYVLHSKPNKEELLLDQLTIRGLEGYNPRLRAQPVNPRSRKFKPYFPGYVFVRMDLDVVGFSILQWLPGASGFVSFGGQPAVVPDGLVDALRHKVEIINQAGGEVLHELKPGDRVRIEGGVFAGYEAIFDARLPGSARVRVLLDMLQGRAAHLEIPAGQLKRISR